LFDAHIDIPSRRTNAELQSDGSVGPLKVGMVLALPSELYISTDDQTNPTQWSRWSSGSNAITAGPLDASGYSSVDVTLRTSVEVSDLSQTHSIFLGANRGRGQVYPNGSASNLTPLRWSSVSTVAGVSYQPKRYGLVSWSRVTDGTHDASHGLSGNILTNQSSLR